MYHYVLPILFALFVWWFSTGVIIYLDGLPQRTFRWSMLGATALLVGSIYGLSVTSVTPTVAGAYEAFTFGLLAWGWQEISFYMGFVTGPRSAPCPEGCKGWRHFGHAIETSLWHELAIIVAAIIVCAVAWNGPNHVGIWTFMVLWWMHQSAKLNVFLGVRNLNEEFLPDHLQFLRSFLTKKPMNLLFPISITISTVIGYELYQAASAAGASDFDRVGYTFLCTLMFFAVLEHWFLVLPLPAAALWSWGLASRSPQKPFEAEIVAGFLGAGKTTFVRNLLANADPAIKTVVLVNDFAENGIDGSLLSRRGAEVVELPNGCICCSLRKDLSTQLQEMVARWAPQRVIIEPSGVADVAALLRVLDQSSIKPLVKKLHVSTIIDAGSFLADYNRMQSHFETQAKAATIVVVNKIDLAGDAELRMIRDTLSHLNPYAQLVSARYGIVDRATAFEIMPAVERFVEPIPVDDEASHAHQHDAHGHTGELASAFTSWSSELGGAYHQQRLRDLLDAVGRGAYGQIERVKGIARAGSGWVHFDVAGGRSTVAAFAPANDEEPRVIAIGRALDRVRLQAAFNACATDMGISC